VRLIVKRNRAFIGLDPGKSGAIALIDDDTGEVLIHKWSPVRMENIQFLESAKNEYDRINAVIEKVNAWPGQGVSSSFKFGQAFGEQLMALSAARIGFEECTPGKWQRDLNLIEKDRSGKKKKVSKTEHKRNLFNRAKELMPDAKGLTLRTADAVLLAIWVRRQHYR